MFTQLTQFVSAHANQAIVIAVLYLLFDDVLVFLADLRKRGWNAVIHFPQITFQLIAEDVSTKVAVAVAGAGLLAFFAGGAHPQQAAMDAMAAGLTVSAVVVLSDIRVRFLALFGVALPTLPVADRRVPAAAYIPYIPPKA
jgi:hypothetical protein